LLSGPEDGGSTALRNIGRPLLTQRVLPLVYTKVSTVIALAKIHTVNVIGIILNVSELKN
jgi:hypothetical protein